MVPICAGSQWTIDICWSKKRDVYSEIAVLADKVDGETALVTCLGNGRAAASASL